MPTPSNGGCRDGNVALRRLLRDDLDDLEEYVPVKPLDVLAAEIGVPVERLVKLDANENLYGPHPAVREEAARALFHIYPDPGQARLREAIAGYVGVEPGHIVAGTGADDLIDVLIRLVLPPAVVIPTPAFGMYRFLAKILRARPIEVPRRPNFDLDVVAIRHAVQHQGARLVFLTHPNNPTGNPVNRAELEALLALNAVIAVDEAYIEFGGESVVPLIAAHPNLVVLRTFSKWAGLAGLRVGYSVSAPELAAHLMALKQPYNVNVAAEAAAIAAIEHRAEIAENIAAIVAERERMSRLLAGLGWLEPLPSCANFVLVAVRDRSAKDVARALRARGILVRYYDRPDLHNYLRISAGRPGDTDALMAALEEL
ncbi:MAG: histidinol-phosphate transaminase [Dehalococcoidia bacterium]|nr:histidinol-phosphate transaminase [Dehalococcoidia bacterium]